MINLGKCRPTLSIQKCTRKYSTATKFLTTETIEELYLWFTVDFKIIKRVEQAKPTDLF